MVPPKPPPHHQGEKHVCFPPRHSRGAHHIGMSAPMMDHPGLPPDLGDWDSLIRACVWQMRTVVAGTCYMVIKQWRTRKLECMKHGSGTNQGRVNKDCP